MGQWNVKLVLKDDKIYTLSFQTEELARNYYNLECESDDWKDIKLMCDDKVVESRGDIHGK